MRQGISHGDGQPRAAEHRQVVAAVAHGGDLRHFMAAFAHDMAAKLGHIRGDVLKIALDAGLAAGFVQYLSRFVHHAGLGGGAAHVDADV